MKGEIDTIQNKIFRAKRTHNNKWVFGYLYEHKPPLQAVVLKGQPREPSTWYILRTEFARWNMPRDIEFYEVDSRTIGQFTGLYDDTKWEDLSSEEQILWGNWDLSEKWQGIPIFEGDTVHCYGGEQYDGLWENNMEIQVTDITDGCCVTIASAEYREVVRK